MKGKVTFVFTIIIALSLFGIGGIVAMHNTMIPLKENHTNAGNEDLYKNSESKLTLATIQNLESVSMKEYATEMLCEYGISNIKKNNSILFFHFLGDRESENNKMNWLIVLAGLGGLIGGMLIEHLFPNKAMIPSIIFLGLDCIVLLSVFTFGYAILAFIFSVIVYLIGWGITFPDLDGSSVDSYSSSILNATTIRNN